MLNVMCKYKIVFYMLTVIAMCTHKYGTKLFIILITETFYLQINNSLRMYL